jgi:hypothetical protein
MRSIERCIAGLVVAGLMTVGLVSPATATATATESPVFDEFPVAEIAATETGGVGAQLLSFGTGSLIVSVPDGVDQMPLIEGQRTSRLSVGLGWTFYVYLNRTDQAALAAGGATSLGILVCAIPGVGIPACAAVAGLLVAGATYIALNGLCPSRLELAVGKGSKCVS